MAFNFANLYQIGGNPSGFATYLYKSDSDSQATVSAAGYFNNSDDGINLQADDLIIVTGDAGGYTLTVVSVSSGAVTTAAMGLGKGGIEIVTTTNVITREESGKTFILNSATAFVTTLPAVEAGLEFTFIAGATQVTGGNHTIVPNASMITPFMVSIWWLVLLFLHLQRAALTGLLIRSCQAIGSTWLVTEQTGM